MLGKLSKFSLPFIFFFLVTFSCRGPEEIPRGGENQIILVCDEAVDEAMYLISLINDTFFTPHEDPLFDFVPISYEQFISYAGFKNILILSYPGSPNYTFFKKIFGDVKPGVYKARGVFRRGDLVVGVLAPKREVLKAYIERYSPALSDIFLERYLYFLKLKAYFTGRDKKKEKEIKKSYGFKILLPEGWQYWVDKPDFLSLVKHYPDRFIFFYITNRKRDLTPEVIMNLRDSLAALYYEGDKIKRDLVKADTITFLGEKALRLIGPWQNDTLVIGGAFISIALNKGNKFLLLDGGVFAPERKNKLEYLLRAQIIFSTLEFVEK